MGRSKYQPREFRLGTYFVGQRPDSPSYYRCWVEGTRTKRVSLNTTDFKDACERLTMWFFENVRLEADQKAPEKVALKDVLNDYWEGHAKALASAKSRKILLRYWNEFWIDATVADVRDVPRQEQFQQFLAAKGLNVGSVNRTLECGASAINRAYKRGVISAAPFVLKVRDRRDRRVTKKGADLTLTELRRFYLGSEEEHWRDLFLILVGTSCRPDAARGLSMAQIDFEAGLIHLNPEGREQTAKFRPTVKLPSLLRSRFADRPAGVIVRWRGERTRKNENVMRAARDRAGLPKKVCLYSIRHFCARWMRSKGVDGWSVACQLGHAAGGKLTTTELYASSDPSYLATACQALQELLELVVAPDTRQAMPQDVAA